MRNICHIISGDLWAGAEVMAYQLIKGHIAFHDLEVLAILLNEGRLAREFRKLGIRTYVMEESNMSFLRILKSLRKVLGGYEPDLIHTHRYKENILAHLSPNSGRRAKLVTTQHGMPETFHGVFNFRHSLIQKYNFYVMRRYFDKVVVVSSDIEKFFTNNFGFNKNMVQVIHNGVSMPEEIFNKRVSDKFIIGSCGRLFPVKDYPLMVEIAKRCAAQSSNIHFKLAGDGPEGERLKDMVVKYGLANSFEFVGHSNEMSGFYRSLDLFINTSIHEGIPMSVLEAMSYGLPVVAPKVGGLPEIIEDGVEGFLIDEREPFLFAEKCLLLQKEQELWNRMSNAARERVGRSFSLDTMVHKYYRLYRSLL